MPQQFQAVKCYKCNTFQVQQVKKLQKFSCAICGEKQTIQHIYAISNAAKDIRLHVQRLNLGAAADHEVEEQAPLQRVDQVQDYEQRPEAPSGIQVDTACMNRAASCWTDFADDGGAALDCVPDEDCEDGIVTVLPDGKRGRWARGDQSRPYKQRRKEESNPMWQMRKTHAKQTPAQGRDSIPQYRAENFGKPTQREYGSHHQHAQPQASLSLDSRPYSHLNPTSNPSSHSDVMPAPQIQPLQRHQQIIPSLNGGSGIRDLQGAAQKAHQNQQPQLHNRCHPHLQHPQLGHTQDQGIRQLTFPAPTGAAPRDATGLPTAFASTTGVDVPRTTAGGLTDFIPQAQNGPPVRARYPSFEGAAGPCGWDAAVAVPQPRMGTTLNGWAHEQRGRAALRQGGQAKVPAGMGLWAEFEEDGERGDCGVDDPDEDGFVTCL
ncbi:hypothetical protein Vretimale_13561 [Volvox reticuliferus]|uniref:MRN complex-interacting protein N-terminal domain-containing protein n=1 Tax=Volvox reticuliferus TaxID=1737510 RepID=A0A8J4BU12_9CHLO|nr:hypothetical protein Vretifemale_382 [Volvox reticuliferus]GIM09747.1 hypothetical protein Vretimale_13561 [Volvox reticuliferus]